ncbi:MAG: hypothetical protein ACLQK4_13305 [Acidimicrobiales bacterium]
MASPVVEYRRAWRFPVSPGELWSSLEEAGNYEAWWPWLRDFTVDGRLLQSGSVMHGVVSPPLPYRMRIDVELVRCSPPEQIDALVHGDLEGTAELRLSSEQEGSRVEVAWNLEMMQLPMRIASRFAYPVLRRGHDFIVDVTVAGLRRHLAEVAGHTGGCP